MSELKPEDFSEEMDEEMTVTIDTDEGTFVCSVVTIMTVNDKDYIALVPIDEEGDPSDEEVWFYGYKENPDDPNEEPELTYIEDDEVYEAVCDAFDEFM